MRHVAEEGVLPDKGLSKGSVGYQRNSIAKNMAVSDRGGAEFLTAVENTRAIKVLPGCAISCCLVSILLVLLHGLTPGLWQTGGAGVLVGVGILCFNGLCYM